MKNFGLDIWSNNNFIIEDGQIRLNYKCMPSLLQIVEEIRSNDVRGPILLRFPHLIKTQIRTLYNYFDKAIQQNSYKGKFHAVFPLKVNQFPNAVEAITSQGAQFNYGLEAGSKAELILAMSKTPNGANITVNGFKDKEMITLGFIAAQSGHNITVTIEGLGELETIIEVAKECDLKVPNIGIRVRLHSTGSGIWAKSGGMDAKFGLTSTEIIEAITLLREANLLDYLNMIHFHIGSQMSDIAPLKKALREAGNIYAELKKMGAEVHVDGQTAVIEGVASLSGAPVVACDLRAGAAVVIAGLCAKGETIVEDVVYIERGYEDFVGKLQRLGADIQCITVPDQPENTQPAIV